MENLALSEIARVILPDGTVIRESRIFVFDTWFAIYISSHGKAVPVHIVPLANFARSRSPRTQPHILTAASGDETAASETSASESSTEWACTRGGCGCGSPIKKVSARQAWLDIEAHAASLTTASTPAVLTPAALDSS